MKLMVMISTILIIFIGCSSKQELKPNQNIIQVEKTQTLDDEFSDEFVVEDVSDPFSGYNEIMTGFNDKLIVYIITPLAEGYNFVFHREIRESVDNFFKNLNYPTRVINNILQGKFKNASEETGRFVINSTVGIFGLFNPAKSEFNLALHQEDFGQTLGFYGVGAGPHIVLPVFGPSNLRDTISMFPDSYISFIDYSPRPWFILTDNVTAFLTVKSYERVNHFSLDIHSYENLKKDAINLYPYFRNTYEQYRIKQINE